MIKKFRVWSEVRLDYVESKTRKGIIIAALARDEPFDGFIVEQFTGLLDENGREIYEGDIVLQMVSPYFSSSEKDEYAKWVDSGKPMRKRHRLVNLDGFVIRPFSECSPYSLKPKDVKVIGNIHENPELLK